MTNHNTATATLPLFETAKAAADVDVRAILEEAKEMRARVLIGMLKGMINSFKSARRAQRTQRSLSQLSDTVLADIGIERAQIPSICRELAAGTYVPQTGIASITVIGRTDADFDQDDRQAELPLAA